MIAASFGNLSKAGRNEGIMVTRPSEKDVIDSDLEPDAWERFERAVDAVSKSGPQHKQSSLREKVEKSDDTDGERPDRNHVRNSGGS